MDVKSWFRKLALPVLSCAALSGAVVPSPAYAGGNGGFFIGIAPPPVYFGPPIYARPPVYYPPPPVYYAPPPVYYAPPPVIYAPPPFYVAPPPRYGQTCYAGPYTCPLLPPGPAGGTCSCPANQGRAYGRAG